MPEHRRRAGRGATVGLDVNGMMREAIGDDGLDGADVDALAERGREIAERLRSRRDAGELPFYELPYQTETLKKVAALGTSVRKNFHALVVLGIGGSALGARAILSALGGEGVPVRVADNIDPWSFGRLLDGLDLDSCAFNVISKSGQTAETMAQFLIVRDRLLRALGAVDYKDHVIVTTDGPETYEADIPVQLFP